MTVPGYGRLASSKAFANPISCSSWSWQSTGIRCEPEGAAAMAGELLDALVELITDFVGRGRALGAH
jgi:hypothetical protein